MKSWLRRAGNVVFGAFLGSLVATALFAPMIALATGWSAPRTWATSELVTASLLNTHLRDNLLHLKEQSDLHPKILVSSTSQVGNIGTGEDDLITYSLPGGTLAADGDVVVFKGGGPTAANGNAKTVKLYFGATEVVSTNPGITFNGAQAWAFEVTIWRTGAATQYALARIWAPAADWLIVFSSSPTETLSGAVTFKATGTATANDDVVQKGLHGMKWPAP